MVEPSRYSRGAWLLALGSAGLLAGCSYVPRTRLDDCHKLSKALQSQNSQLKDETLSLKSQYDDLAQRADDDARRLKAKDDENRRLLASVQAYQDERDRFATEFARLKRLAENSVDPASTVYLERFKAFASGRPGCQFDARSGVLTLASDHLFAPGTDRLTPDAHPLLRSIAELLGAPGASDLRLLVASTRADAAVRRAGLTDPRQPPDDRLILDRASRIRDALAAAGNIALSRIEMAGSGTSRSTEDGKEKEVSERHPRIIIQLRQDGDTPPTPSSP